MQSLFSRFGIVLGLLLTLASADSVNAQRAVFTADADSGLPNYLAAIELHTAKELTEAMQRAEQLHIKARMEGQDIDPVAFVLHGPEVRTLLSPNYENNKRLVDLAARLTAFEYIELKVCRRWMGGEEIDPALLPPFIGTVPWGAAEMERLMRDEGYIYF